MYIVKNTTKEYLPDVVECHNVCFPASLSTKLGKQYVLKSLEWFLVNPDRFLFHIEADGKVIGYCGGFVPARAGDGSSSGMLQHAFKQAISGMVKNPLLIFNKEVRQYYPFIWMNIKRRITGKAKPIKPTDPAKPFHRFVGLVVIGVHPEYRGSGVAQQLMTHFEEKVREYKQQELVLSVRKDNSRAIKAYTNFGWDIAEEHKHTYVLKKFI